MRGGDGVGICGVWTVEGWDFGDVSIAGGGSSTEFCVQRRRSGCY